MSTSLCMSSCFMDSLEALKLESRNLVGTNYTVEWPRIPWVTTSEASLGIQIRPKICMRITAVEMSFTLADSQENESFIADLYKCLVCFKYKIFVHFC